MAHIHHPVETETHDTIVEHDSGAGLGMVFGLVLVVLLIGAVLWVAFAGVGIPRGAIGGGQGGTTINNNNPAASPAPSSAPSINIPPRIDINVNPNGSPPPSDGGAGQ